jgi:hypothetical protein
MTGMRKKSSQIKKNQPQKSNLRKHPVDFDTGQVTSSRQPWLWVHSLTLDGEPEGNQRNEPVKSFAKRMA